MADPSREATGLAGRHHAATPLTPPAVLFARPTPSDDRPDCVEAAAVVASRLWVQEDVMVWRVQPGDKIGTYEAVGTLGIYESHTADRDELFRWLHTLRGPCVGRLVLPATETAGEIEIGWVFQAPDPQRRALIQCWVTVHGRPPTGTAADPHYHYADRRVT